MHRNGIQFIFPVRLRSQAAGGSSCDTIVKGRRCYLVCFVILKVPKMVLFLIYPLRFGQQGGIYLQLLTECILIYLVFPFLCYVFVLLIFYSMDTCFKYLMRTQSDLCISHSQSTNSLLFSPILFNCYGMKIILVEGAE